MYIKSYRDLEVWNKAVELTLLIYEYTKPFPSDEKFGLTMQLRRASVSIASNLAEGSTRKGTKDLLRFVNIAGGSLAEVETQSLIAYKLKYLEPTSYEKLIKLTGELGRQLNSLYQSLEKRMEVAL